MKLGRGGLDSLHFWNMPRGGTRWDLWKPIQSARSPSFLGRRICSASLSNAKKLAIVTKWIHGVRSDQPEGLEAATGSPGHGGMEVKIAKIGKIRDPFAAMMSSPNQGLGTTTSWNDLLSPLAGFSSETGANKAKLGKTERGSMTSFGPTGPCCNFSK